MSVTPFDAELRREQQLTEAMAPVLDRIMDARTTAPSVLRDLRVSLRCEDIAQALSDVAALRAGGEPRLLREHPPHLTAYYRQLAERAIATLDPAFDDRAADYTVEDMTNGPYSHRMSTEELVRETLAVFRAYVAKPRAVQS